MSDRAKDILITLAVSLGMGILIFCLIFFLRGIYTLFGWSDALTFSGVFIILSGALTALGRLGAYDMFVYGFMDIFRHMNPKPAPKKYQDFVDYKEQMKEKRAKKSKAYLLFFAVGGVILTVGLVLRLVLYLTAGH